MASKQVLSRGGSFSALRSPSRGRVGSSDNVGGADEGRAFPDEAHWLGRASCACCTKTGHATWYPRPTVDTLRISIQVGREGSEFVCATCDRTNKVKLAREKEFEKMDVDPLMRTPARKKGERPKMVVCAICGKQYTFASLVQHEKKCVETWQREQDALPKSMRSKALPVLASVTMRAAADFVEEETARLAADADLCAELSKDPAALAAAAKAGAEKRLADAMEASALEAWDASQAQLTACPNGCGRTFAPDRVGMHVKGCIKDNGDRVTDRAVRAQFKLGEHKGAAGAGGGVAAAGKAVAGGASAGAGGAGRGAAPGYLKSTTASKATAVVGASKAAGSGARPPHPPPLTPHPPPRKSAPQATGAGDTFGDDAVGTAAAAAAPEPSEKEEEEEEEEEAAEPPPGASSASALLLEPPVLALLEGAGLADDGTQAALRALGVGTMAQLLEAIGSLPEANFKDAGLNGFKLRKLTAAVRAGGAQPSGQPSQSSQPPTPPNPSPPPNEGGAAVKRPPKPAAKATKSSTPGYLAATSTSQSSVAKK